MKSVLIAVILLTLTTANGCSRKTPPPSGTEPASDTQAVVAESAAQPDKAPAVTAELRQTLGEVDLSKSLEAIRNEVASMNLEQLKETAQRYKTALLEKKAAMTAVTEKLAKIPLAERLSPESQKLAAELKNLTEPVKALTERLAVYIEAIKANGGDATGLMP